MTPKVQNKEDTKPICENTKHGEKQNIEHKDDDEGKSSLCRVFWDFFTYNLLMMILCKYSEIRHNCIGNKISKEYNESVHRLLYCFL